MTKSLLRQPSFAAGQSCIDSLVEDTIGLPAKEVGLPFAGSGRIAAGDGLEIEEQGTSQQLIEVLAVLLAEIQYAISVGHRHDCLELLILAVEHVDLQIKPVFGQGEGESGKDRAVHVDGRVRSGGRG